ncbi:MAG: hypothetical protein H6534_04680 [Chthonomonadaceae bacterium]|nr:hypothetical protein [Chthonomonadaceae bacterium]
MRAMLLAFALCLSAAASAQSELVGEGQFPQTRTLSALPGGVIGVLPDGTPSFRGASALSTPIAFSLSNWHYAFALGTTSATALPRFFERDKTGEFNDANSTAYGMVGIPSRFGSFTVSLMLISRLLKETTINVQWTPSGQRGPVTVGYGVQDLWNTSGTHVPFESRSATSHFVVATAKLPRGGYASLGTGTQRFNGVFGNVSLPVAERWKAIAEYDTYNWNGGVAYDMGRLSNPLAPRRPMEATAFFGYVRGKYATWTVGVSF